MPVTFKSIRIGQTYTRPELAKMWGYKGYQAIARGLVTPRNDNKLIYFITEDKQPSARQYKDQLVGRKLTIEGPDDHFADERAIASKTTSTDELHLFYRERHHAPFEYKGRMHCVAYKSQGKAPTQFEFQLQ
jgi:hypothetical protein